MRELALNVMDIAQNSLSAGAGFIEIEVEQLDAVSTLRILIRDNGKGVSAEQIRQMTDPFYTTRTTRDVGLGIPLFKMEAEQTGGSFSISSELGKGTSVCAEFRTDSIDMTPLGDINAVIALLITCNPEVDFRFLWRVTAANGQETGTVAIDTREIKEVLGGDVALNDPAVVQWINGYLAEQAQEMDLAAGR